MTKRTKRYLAWPLALILLLAAILFCRWAVKAALAPADGADSGEWNLILVNDKHHLPRDYEVELTDLSNGERVDSRIYPDLQAMFDQARAEGLDLFVAAGFRTWEEQQQLLDEKTAEYREEGHSNAEAKRLARQWVAEPGASEHQLGIAVDINADADWSSSEEVYAWLEENSYKYGFINRYPADKTAVTGIINEPWHYRYVGYEAALEMYSRGLCLEEYLQERE
ncbi:MAG: M15 family metallopeptidase [Firmicutes bacterium]|nr:M15 family metallopeptidase [Bacillota bacterium]